jgi:hypothetical protein
VSPVANTRKTGTQREFCQRAETPPPPPLLLLLLILLHFFFPLSHFTFVFYKHQLSVECAPECTPLVR